MALLRSRSTLDLSDVLTGWRKLIGCLKFQVIFHKRATNDRALLRKMTYEEKMCENAASMRHWTRVSCAHRVGGEDS